MIYGKIKRGKRKNNTTHNFKNILGIAKTPDSINSNLEMISTPGIIHSMQHIPLPQPGTWKCTQVLCDGERGKNTVAGRERKILCFTITLCIKCVFILLDKRSLIVCFKQDYALMLYFLNYI